MYLRREGGPFSRVVGHFARSHHAPRDENLTRSVRPTIKLTHYLQSARLPVCFDLIDSGPTSASPMKQREIRRELRLEE